MITSFLYWSFQKIPLADFHAAAIENERNMATLCLLQMDDLVLRPCDTALQFCGRDTFLKIFHFLLAADFCGPDANLENTRS
ncbi:MAG: hypothetical protein LKH78_07415 [Weizmannia coagulans]|nr:hypothetical protein [Heyndrickxia coagulans]MCI1575543.1 hypothetical protein [Heyndrickxia coagulans]